MKKITPETFLQATQPSVIRDDIHDAMHRANMIALGAIQKRTRVRTGLLRRSMRSSVLSISGMVTGVTGSNVYYLKHQRNDPIVEGYTDVEQRIHDTFAHITDAVVTRISYG